MRNLRVRRFREREPADDVVGTSREPFQGVLRGLRGRRLYIDIAVQCDDRVDAEDRLPRALQRSRARLAQRVLPRDLDRVAGGELLDVDRERLEGDAELLEDRAALRRAAGEDQVDDDLAGV